MPKSKGFTTFMKTERGFTLIELLVVISILAVLSVVGMTVFTGVTKGARDARRKADLDAIMKALAQYSINRGGIPLSNQCGAARSGALHGVCIDASDSPNNWYLGDSLVSNGYMPSVPYDPSTGPKACSYHYYTDASGKYAQLSAKLEGPSAADLDTFNRGPIPGSECTNGDNYRIFSSF